MLGPEVMETLIFMTILLVIAAMAAMWAWFIRRNEQL